MQPTFSKSCNCANPALAQATVVDNATDTGLKSKWLGARALVPGVAALEKFGAIQRACLFDNAPSRQGDVSVSIVNGAVSSCDPSRRSAAPPTHSWQQHQVQCAIGLRVGATTMVTTMHSMAPASCFVQGQSP